MPAKPAKKPAAKAPVKPARREVTPEVVATAIRMREEGAKWSEVIEATGFNGATLRPHMTRAQGSPASVAAVNVETIEPTAASIAAARNAGMSWYAIAQRLDLAEAKVRNLGIEGGAPAAGRVYLSKPKPAKAEPKPAAKKAPARKADKPARKGTARTSRKTDKTVTTRKVAPAAK